MVKKNNIIRNISIVVIVLLLMSLIVFLVGRSFGFFQYAKKGDTVNVITINGLDVNITNNSDNALNLQEAYPMYDSEGLTQSPLTFTIENTSSRAIDYTLKVENDTEKQAACKLENNDPCPQLATSNIKYAYKIGNGEYSTPQNLGTNSNIILSTTILGNQTQQISLILWIDSSAGNEIQGKYFFGQLIIEGTKADAVQTTIYSGAVDEIYYYDNNNQKVVLGTTDATGKLENALLPLDTTLTLYSTVAKDPNNLSNPYSKSITTAQSMADVYLMPDGEVLYWYGYKHNWQIISSSNGWTSSMSMNSVIENGNSYTASTITKYGWSGMGTVNPISGITVYAIASGVSTNTTGWYGHIRFHTDKNLNNRLGNTQLSTTDVFKLSLDISSQSNIYLTAGAASSGVKAQSIWYAIWYE